MTSPATLEQKIAVVGTAITSFSKDSNSEAKTAKRGRKNARFGIRTLQEKFELFADETATSLLPLLDRFEEEGIDFQVFLALTQDDMRELGLKMGDRKRVVMAQEYFVK